MVKKMSYIGRTNIKNLQVQIVSMNLSQVSRLAHVTVWVPPEDPRIVDGPVVQVKENVEVSLRCESKGGKPAAKVTYLIL